jgi:HD-like signal output (HDOD) protein
MVPKSLVEEIGALYSLPEVALRVNELLNSDQASNEQLEQVIVYDPALTAQLLKLVNSAYYGFSRSIETVSRAVSVIGQQELRNLVMAASVTSTFEDVPHHLVDMETFWFHSITCGCLARLLAVECRCKNQERFFITGLLHSIGKLVFFSKFPEQSAQILRDNHQSVEAMVAAERRIFGFDYAELGAALLKEWQLPESMCKLVAYQLDPFSVAHCVEEACIMHVAVKITDSIEPCVITTAYDFNDFNPDYDAEAWQSLGLSEELVKPLIWNASSQSLNILGVIKPGSNLVF